MRMDGDWRHGLAVEAIVGDEEARKQAKTEDEEVSPEVLPIV
jgi:hypothetical protein